MNDFCRRFAGWSRRSRSEARLRIGILLLVFVGIAVPAQGQANEEQYRRVVTMGLEALENRRLDESIAAFKRCLDLRANDALCAYNLACAYSLKRDLRTALDWLSRSIEWGYDDLEHLQKDTDLDNLRAEPRYLALVARLRGDPDPIPDDVKTVQQTSELIVMLEGRLEGGPTIGAGIIFGRQSDRIFVATAGHTVRRGDVAATDLRLKLRASPDQPVSARLTEHFDRGLDLAVLVATLPAERTTSFCSVTAFDVMADPNEVSRGDPVYPVGYPNGAPWAMPVAPDRIAQLVGNDITFQSAFISGGHSGGGLITEQGRLVGMIKADQQPFGVALALPRVLEAVRQWGYPVHLRTSSSFLKTPMHEAIEKRDLAEVRKLVDACAYVNTLDDTGKTPLHLASALGWADAVRLLLGAGAQVAARSRETADSDDIHSFTALHLATTAAVAELLIAWGAEVNAQALDFADRDWGGTPLHKAVTAGAVEVMDVLLRGGADVDAPSIDGSPLAVAVRRRAPAAARLLIARGADLNPRNTSDVPLYIAADEGAEEMTRLLLEARADPNLAGTFGNPLHRAARHGHVAIARMLLAAGADVNAKTTWEVTPLHEAAGEGRLDLVRLLLGAGASPTAVDRNGQTPLHLAEQRGHQEIAALLRSRLNRNQPPGSGG